MPRASPSVGVRLVRGGDSPRPRRRGFPVLHRRWIHPLWTRKDGRSSTRFLGELEASQFWPGRDVEALRWGRLRRLLAHAYAHCPFYRRRWDEAGVHPRSIRGLEHVERLPLVSKADIQTHAPEMCRSDWPRTRLIENRTGGSTGEPLVFYLDPARVRSRAAATIRHDRWAGKEVGDLTASVWGNPRDLSSLRSAWERFKDRWVHRTFHLDLSQASEASIEAFLDRVRASRPTAYVGYANGLYLLAQFLERRGISDLPRPRGLIATAEVLEPERRAVIERALGAPVFDRYGCREVSVIASQCEAREALHENAECLLVETLRGGRPTAPGETGEVVLTDLLNLGMPLIRYRIRDVGTLVPGPCACGRGLPRMRLVGGRVTDFVSTPDGRIVSGAAMTICLVAKTPGVRQVQVVQERREAVTLRVVPGPGFDAAAAVRMRSEARVMLGQAIQIEVEPVEEIAAPASGKHRFCISHVDPFS